MARTIYYCDKCNFSIDDHSKMVGHICQERNISIHKSKEIIKKLVSDRYSNYQDQIPDIFLDNEYTERYYNIIKKSRKENYTCYTEKHHILPRSLGGSDSKDNLITLTAENHFICHYLLVYMLRKDTREYFKMLRAFSNMRQGSSKHRYVDAKLYAELKEEISRTFSIAQSGKGNSQYGKIWVSNFSLKTSIKIDSDKLQEKLDSGWVKKRISRFDLYNTDGSKKTKKQIKEESRKSILSKLEKFRTNNGIQDIDLKLDVCNNSFILNMADSLRVTGFNFLSTNIKNEIDRYIGYIKGIYYLNKCSFTKFSDFFSIDYTTTRAIFNRLNIEVESEIEYSDRMRLLNGDFSEKIFVFRKYIRNLAIDTTNTKIHGYDLLLSTNISQLKIVTFINLDDAAKFDIPLDIFLHPANQKIVPKRARFSKKSLISYEELLERIREWDN